MLARDNQDAGTRGAQLFLPPETGSQSPDNEHAYAVATQLRRQTGRDQFVVLTRDPLQPVRVTASLEPDGEQLLALIL